MYTPVCLRVPAHIHPFLVPAGRWMDPFIYRLRQDRQEDPTQRVEGRASQQHTTNGTNHKN